MPTILDEIVAAKRREVARQKREVPPEALEQRLAAQSAPLNFSGALWGDRVRLIAEVKKASPSRGLLRADFDPVALATTYAENGAAAVSVLTDPRFQGTLEHLAVVKSALQPRGVPVLRKDFILDAYQVHEARAYGADAILLIVAILSPDSLKELLRAAERFWMQCLVEVHDERELDVAVAAGAEVIGINNRDLHTFKTDLSVTERLAPRIPKGKIIVSESGIFTRDDVRRVGRLGVHAVLVGEALVTARDVAAKVRDLV
ncbi:MAG: indole-3-glycerol phosphate synthase TrpC [Chloroflexota bacterium]|nr:indole-3-glycerol phosphate synthase TrpC [Chloroflexota bacterium]